MSKGSAVSRGKSPAILAADEIMHVARRVPHPHPKGQQRSIVRNDSCEPFVLVAHMATYHATLNVWPDSACTYPCLHCGQNHIRCGHVSSISADGRARARKPKWCRSALTHPRPECLRPGPGMDARGLPEIFRHYSRVMLAYQPQMLAQPLVDFAPLIRSIPVTPPLADAFSGVFPTENSMQG